MAFTIKGKYGASSTPSVTGTPGGFVIGPPAHGGQAQGIYACQGSDSRGTGGTYTWIYDQPIRVGATVPTGYTAHSF